MGIVKPWQALGVPYISALLVVPQYTFKYMVCTPPSSYVALKALVH